MNASPIFQSYRLIRFHINIYNGKIRDFTKKDGLVCHFSLIVYRTWTWQGLVDLNARGQIASKSRNKSGTKTMEWLSLVS